MVEAKLVAVLVLKSLSLEIALGAKTTMALSARYIPLLPHTQALAEARRVIGALDSNWARYGHGVVFASSAPAWQRSVLTDPQTLGELLVACAPARTDEIQRSIVAAGHSYACLVGRLEAGGPALRVDP